jgi:hypothetical protein
MKPKDSLPWSYDPARRIQSTISHTIYILIVVLYTYLRLDIQRGLFLSSSSTKIG